MLFRSVDSQGRHTYAYGTFAKGDPRAVGGDTLFEIGSLTKVFTSLLLADMVQRNEVALDGPAARYLPEHVRMPERDGKAITLLHLSTHTSGLPRLPSNIGPNPDGSPNPYRAWDRAALVAALRSDGPGAAPAVGRAVAYSNLDRKSTRLNSSHT